MEQAVWSVAFHSCSGQPSFSLPAIPSSATEVCGVTLLETFADRDEPVVVVTQCEVGTRNRVCGYLLSDIDSNMNTVYEVQR